MFEKIITIVMGVIILIAIGLPISDDLVITATTQTADTVSNEYFNGTSGVAYTAASYVASVTSFAAQAIETDNNVTALASTANGTRTLNLTTPIGVGSANLTVVTAGAHKNTSVSIGTTYVGNLNLSKTFTVPTSLLAAGNVFNFTYYDNSTGFGVTNFTLVTPYWLASTDYGVDAGQVVPTADGNFLMSYNSGLENTGLVLVILVILPVMIGMLALIIISNELI